MLDIITLGSNTVDLFAHTDKAEIIDITSFSRKEEFISYKVGDKILINKLIRSFGGNGANTAVCFARLGFKTGYVGKIGKDQNGAAILSNLKKNKVVFLGAYGEESGFSVVLDAYRDDRTILVYKGCNNDLRRSELKKNKLKSKWLYISSMLGESLATMAAVAEEAHKDGVHIAFNPSATLLEKEQASAMNFIGKSEILVLNKEEAESLVGHDSIEANMKKLLAYGPKTVVITDGKRGAYALHDGNYYKVDPVDVKVVETTGAGDAFASTLTAGVMLGKPFEYALRMAAVNAESVIMHHGAQNDLLSRERLFYLVRKDKRKITKTKA